MFAMLLFTHHYPGMNFGYVTVNGVNSNVCDCERYYVTRFDLEIIV